MSIEFRIVHPPSSDEGLLEVLNLHGEDGFRYSGMIYDKLVLERDNGQAKKKDK